MLVLKNSRSAALLAGGVVAGPLFLLVVVFQDLTREGFDPVRHPLSLLSLGDGGWLQIANFVVAGLLNIAFALGVRRLSKAGAVLIAGYGLGLIVAGVFVRDPGGGYPPGVPEPSSPSWHQTVHGIGALIVFGSLVGACVVFARWFAARGDRGWARYSVVTGVVLVGLLVATRHEKWESLLLRGAAVAGWMWVSLVACRLMPELKG